MIKKNILYNPLKNPIKKPKTMYSKIIHIKKSYKEK